jgi:hypothetical protein
VKADNRKLGSTEDFTAAVTNDMEGGAGGSGGPLGIAQPGVGFPGGFGGRGRGGRGGGPGGGASGRPDLSLKGFFEQRRAYLLNYPEIKGLSPTEAVPQ